MNHEASVNYLFDQIDDVITLVAPQFTDEAERAIPVLRTILARLRTIIVEKKHARAIALLDSLVATPAEKV